jgi:hypothetical protein
MKKEQFLNELSSDVAFVTSRCQSLFSKHALRFMPGKQAKFLSEHHIRDLHIFADTTRYPERNRVIVLLSVKGGLRAGEIAPRLRAMRLIASR